MVVGTELPIVDDVVNIVVIALVVVALTVVVIIIIIIKVAVAHTRKYDQLESHPET